MLLRIQSTSKVLSGVPDFSEGVHREIWPFKEDQKERKGKNKTKQKNIIHIFILRNHEAKKTVFTSTRLILMKKTSLT